MRQSKTKRQAMKTPIVKTLALITGFAVIAGATAARSDLSQEPTVTEGLISVAIAYEISEQCDDISARRLRGITYLLSLKSEARNLGYTDAQIDAFVDNDAAQDRLEAIARQRLAGLGVVAGQEATYCDAGRAQIAARTTAGRLLR